MRRACQRRKESEVGLSPRPAGRSLRETRPTVAAGAEARREHVGVRPMLYIKSTSITHTLGDPSGYIDTGIVCLTGFRRSRRWFASLESTRVEDGFDSDVVGARIAQCVDLRGSCGEGANAVPETFRGSGLQQAVVSQEFGEDSVRNRDSWPAPRKPVLDDGHRHRSLLSNGDTDQKALAVGGNVVIHNTASNLGVVFTSTDINVLPGAT
jgi:hypothetical protein